MGEWSMRDFICDKDRSEELCKKILRGGHQHRDEYIKEAEEYMRGQTVAYSNAYLAGLIAGVELI